MMRGNKLGDWSRSPHILRLLGTFAERDLTGGAAWSSHIRKLSGATDAAIVTAGEIIRCDLSPYPNIQRWLNNMKKLPSWPKVNEAFYGIVDSVKGQQFEVV
jgi:hypothetical protein